MADNVAITAGSGTAIATDDVGSAHYQKIKIAIGADGAVDGLLDYGQGAMAASLPVAIASNQSAVAVTPGATEVHLGEVGGNTAIIEVTLSLDTNIYASGDVLADTQEAATAVRVAAGKAILQSIVVVDKDDQGQAMDIVILETNVTLGVENAAVSISDANAVEICGIFNVSSGDYVDMGGVQVATLTNIGAVVQAGTASTSLYVGAISRGTGTYSASGVIVRLGLLRD